MWDCPSRFVVFFLPSFCVAQLRYTATTHSGSVRAADQFVPGAMITATQGEKKVVAYTDENGRYTMDLDSGVWDLSVEMFGFTPVHSQLTISPGSYRDWTIEMPRRGEAAETKLPPAPSATRRWRPRNSCHYRPTVEPDLVAVREGEATGRTSEIDLPVRLLDPVVPGRGGQGGPGRGFQNAAGSRHTRRPAGGHGRG